MIVTLSLACALFAFSVKAKEISIPNMVTDLLNDNLLMNESDEMRMYYGLNKYLDDYTASSGKQICYQDILYIMDSIKDKERLLGVFIHLISTKHIPRQFSEEETDDYTNKLLDIASNNGDPSAKSSVIHTLISIFHYTIDLKKKMWVDNQIITHEELSTIDIRTRLDEKWLKKVDRLLEIAEEWLNFKETGKKTVDDDDDNIGLILLGEINTLRRSGLVALAPYKSILKKVVENESNTKKLRLRSAESLFEQNVIDEQIIEVVKKIVENTDDRVIKEEGMHLLEKYRKKNP